METVNMSDFGLLHWEYENPQYFESFWFEKVDGNELRLVARRYLPTCGVICSVYFLFIWLGPKWMKNREPFDLHKPLAAWNFFLSLFSFIVVIRTGPELSRILTQPAGFYQSICVVDHLNYPTTFWGFLYVISKIVELGDTVFIVLRKKPLTFLHGFHHFNMVWSSFFLFMEGEPWLRWPALLNSFVHTIMYSYFGLRALKVKLSLKVSMAITSLQIMQFVCGLSGQYYQLVFCLGKGIPCVRTTTSIAVSTTFGFSYLFLFLNLFYTSYIAKGKYKTE